MGKRDKKGRNRGSSGNNRKTSEEFLLKNKKKTDIVETSSGLQYMIIEKGTGENPKETDYAQVHQRILLLNGTIIDDTYRKNEPVDIKIEELIEGYKEGLLLMNKGARYKFFIPPELAWGKKGSSNRIPPNSLLILDVRLIDFW